ncbi:hypothetical protein OOU_Y34scaffold00104g1 [Pyricularia oryzae Y34]|uniref:Uncharacterized protein n=2 Tax=Pyricularia oryzae TaxID=318829 RepID=A0AA97P9E6_PYRO3|nr:hypothetical protein OOU_Y34scaffold00104g1 [Pyricularia oryzae Y34]
MPCLSQLSGQISSFLHEGRLRNSKADCIEEFMAAAWSACPIENMITNTSFAAERPYEKLDRRLCQFELLVLRCQNLKNLYCDLDEEYGQTDEQVREEDPQGKVVTGVRFSNLKELAFKECNIDALNFDRIISQAPELRSCFSSGSIKSNLQASEIVKALRRVAPTLEYLQISTPTRLRASHPALTFTKPIIPMPSLKEMVSLRKLSLAACVLKLLACPHSHVSFLSACITGTNAVHGGAREVTSMSAAGE